MGKCFFLPRSLWLHVSNKVGDVVKIMAILMSMLLSRQMSMMFMKMLTKKEKLPSLQVPNSCHTRILRIQGEIFKISVLSSSGQLKILQLILKMISLRLFGQIGEEALVRYLCHIIEQLSKKNVSNSQIAHSELHRHYRDCRRCQFGGP